MAFYEPSKELERLPGLIYWLNLALLPIMDQNHKGSVLKIAKVPLHMVNSGLIVRAFKFLLSTLYFMDFENWSGQVWPIPAFLPRIIQNSTVKSQVLTSLV